MKPKRKRKDRDSEQLPVALPSADHGDIQPAAPKAENLPVENAPNNRWGKIFDNIFYSPVPAKKPEPPDITGNPIIVACKIIVYVPQAFFYWLSPGGRVQAFLKTCGCIVGGLAILLWIAKLFNLVAVSLLYGLATVLVCGVVIAALMMVWQSISGDPNLPVWIKNVFYGLAVAALIVCVGGTGLWMIGGNSELEHLLKTLSSYGALLAVEVLGLALAVLVLWYLVKNPWVFTLFFAFAAAAAIFVAYLWVVKHFPWILSLMQPVFPGQK